MDRSTFTGILLQGCTAIMATLSCSVKCTGFLVEVVLAPMIQVYSTTRSLVCIATEIMCGLMQPHGCKLFQDYCCRHHCPHMFRVMFSYPKLCRNFSSSCQQTLLYGRVGKRRHTFSRLTVWIN